MFFTTSESPTSTTRKIAVPCPISRKKFSIFTSATSPYGPPRNARISGTGMTITT
jgi:hypothetical protein